MYQNHAVKVQQYAQLSASNLSDATLMAGLSIRQPWLNIGKQMIDVKTNKLKAKSLWGFKKFQANTYNMLTWGKCIIT